MYCIGECTRTQSYAAYRILYVHWSLTNMNFGICYIINPRQKVTCYGESISSCNDRLISGDGEHERALPPATDPTLQKKNAGGRT